MKIFRLFLLVLLAVITTRTYAVKEWTYSTMNVIHNSTADVSPGCMDVEILSIQLVGLQSGSGPPGGTWGIDALTVTLNNTSDADLENVKLWWSSDGTLNTNSDELLGTDVSPSVTSVFDFTDKTGFNINGTQGYLFVTFTIKTSASCGVGNTIDASIAVNALTLESTLSPNCDAAPGGDCTKPDVIADPAGNRTIVCATNNLSAGDIAMVGENSTDPDEFTFVALTAIGAGEIIWFTDRGYDATANPKSFFVYSAGEGSIFWTAPGGGVACGTEVTLENNAGWTASAGSVGGGNGTFSLATTGDQILAFQGSEQCPEFIAALDNGTALNWDANASSAQTSAIPPGLSEGTNCVSTTPDVNVVYNCSTTSGSAAAIRSAVNTTGNWTGSVTTITLPVPCTFTCGTAVDCYNNIQDGDETGIDCGGASCPPCGCN